MGVFFIYLFITFLYNIIISQHRLKYKKGGRITDGKQVKKRRKEGIRMNNELKTMTEAWMALERKTLEQRKEADAFYEANLMK